MGFGMPELSITFRAAAQEVNNRSKQGIVALIVRDAKTELAGVHTLFDEGDLPEELGAANAAYAASALTGSELGKPSKVLLVVTAPESPEGTTTNLEKALELAAGYTVDYLAGPADLTAEEAEKVGAWTEAQRKQYRTVKAVLPDYDGDSMGIINVSMDGAAAGDSEYTSAGLCARVAGILAGIPSSCSATGVALPELTAAPALEDPGKEVDAGKLILTHDGMKVKLGRAVNSLVTVPEEGSEDWKKIKIVEGMDLITYFLRTSVDDSWRGRYANSYDNQCLLLVAIRDYFKELEGSVVEKGSGWAEIDLEEKTRYLKGQGVDVSRLSEQQIKEYRTGSRVFIAFGCHILDAMEDFKFRGEL